MLTTRLPNTYPVMSSNNKKRPNNRKFINYIQNHNNDYFKDNIKKQILVRIVLLD
jgi:hypothetical protein